MVIFSTSLIHWIKRIDKRYFLGFAAFFILASLSFFFLTDSSNNGNRENNLDKSNEFSNLCSKDEIGSELKSKFVWFGNDRTQDIAPLIEKIKSTEKHENSINCLYVLGKDAFYRGDTAQAVSYFEKLIDATKNSESWLDIELGVETRDEVSARIAYIRSENKGLINYAAEGFLPRQDVELSDE